jgi:phospholipid/cholesterol/gamma-HCH transport system permease protein
MVLQTGSQFTRFGQKFSDWRRSGHRLVRELGPAFTGLLVTGRCATGIASELGSMLVTEQVDAMRAMGTDPSRKLVVPRVLAALTMLPLLTAIMDFIGLLGGCVASVFSLRLSAIEFWRRAIDALDFADLMQGFSNQSCSGSFFHDRVLQRADRARGTQAWDAQRRRRRAQARC